MTPEITEALMLLLSTLITLFFGWLAKSAATWFKSQTTLNASQELVIAAELAVREVEQTLRAGLEDGKLTAEEKSQLRHAAVMAARDHLGGTVTRLATDHVDAAMTRAIEAAVNKLRETRHVG